MRVPRLIAAVARAAAGGLRTKVPVAQQPGLIAAVAQVRAVIAVAVILAKVAVALIAARVAQRAVAVLKNSLRALY